jgi:formylglycine-generating enzyme required for sulfatase activity
MPLTSEQLFATIEWITLPDGTFTMGSPEDESGRWSDEILHTVTLKAFRMSIYEVTFDQYDLFCEATGMVKPDDNGWGRGTRPVIWINWNNAVAFAEWIGCRLPTEAEWEYACRAGTNTVFNMGDNLNTSEANFDGNYPYEYGEKGIFLEKTTPVGSFAPNQWDLAV